MDRFVLPPIELHAQSTPRLLAACSGLFVYGLSHLAPYGTSLSIGRALSGTAHAVTNILNLPLMFRSDLFLPAALLPIWMQRIMEVSPLYLLVQARCEVYAGRRFRRAPPA